MRKYWKAAFEDSLKLDPESMAGMGSRELDDVDPS